MRMPQAKTRLLCSGSIHSAHPGKHNPCTPSAGQGHRLRLSPGLRWLHWQGVAGSGVPDMLQRAAAWQLIWHVPNATGPMQAYLCSSGRGRRCMRWWSSRRPL